MNTWEWARWPDPGLGRRVSALTTTRPGGVRIVMRLDVEQEGNLMGFFIASSAMEPITGLLAEFRKELYRALDDRYSSKVSIEEERDVDVRREMQGRPSLLDIEDQEGPDDA